MRDDFLGPVKNELAKRVGMRCSNPECRLPTSGPQSSSSGAVNIGVAAHITAAAPGGKRFDPSISTEVRASTENGVWLCQNCAKLIDADDTGYSVDRLREWKLVAESTASLELRGYKVVADDSAIWRKIESAMSDLLQEMRTDLQKTPVQREFFLMHRRLSYNMSGPHFFYYFDDHPNLRQKIRILENYGLLNDITYTSVEKFLISERLADYLLGEQ